MKSWHVGLVLVIVAMGVMGCSEVGQAGPDPAVLGGGWGYTSAYLNTSHQHALPIILQLVLGTFKLEGTENAVTPAQARILLPLWQTCQGKTLRGSAEWNAALAQIEKAMTPAQEEAIAAMRLTPSDLQSWAQGRGISIKPPGGGQRPPSDGQGPPGGQGLPGDGQAPPGSGQGPPIDVFLDPLIELLSQRAAEADQPAQSTPLAHQARSTGAPSPTAVLSGDSVPPTATPTNAPTTAGKPTPTATPASVSAGYPGKLAVRGADGIIYVARADGFETYPLTAGIDPSWSPAPPEGGTGGQQITFVRWREPWGLFVINVTDPLQGADGTGERQLIAEKDLRQPAWSPSGNTIAVIQSRLETATTRHPPAPPGQPTPEPSSREVQLDVLKAVNPNSGVYEGDYPTDEFVRSPSWSPDGARLAYEGARGIYVTARGEDPLLLTPDLAQSTAATPAWSPRGDRIAYVRQMHDHWEIWSMTPDGTDQRRLTPVGTVAGEPVYNNVAPAWSPDGQYIAFLTDRAGEWRVYVMRAGGTGQRQLLDVPVSYEFNGDRVLDWTW